MKAVVFKEIDQIAVDELPQPRPGPGEVVLKVHDCGICGSDLHAVQYGMGLRPGAVMGHEFCGEIVELGEGVGDFALGERVTSLPFMFCGDCEFCRRDEGIHCPRVKGLGLGQLPGAYAEYVACGAASLLRLPDVMTSRQGALVEPLSVGLHGVNRSRLEPGGACVIMGAGPIGLAVLLWCKARGAATVVVSEPSAARGQMAMRLGATAVVNPREANPAVTMQELCGRSPNLVFECIGVRGALGEAIGISGVGGQVVVLGVCMEPDQVMPLHCVLKEVRLDFALGYGRAEFQATIQALADGRIDATPMVTDIIGIEQVPSMFATLRRPTSQAKVLVEFA